MSLFILLLLFFFFFFFFFFLLLFLLLLFDRVVLVVDVEIVIVVCCVSLKARLLKRFRTNSRCFKIPIVIFVVAVAVVEAVCSSLFGFCWLHCGCCQAF